MYVPAVGNGSITGNLNVTGNITCAQTVRSSGPLQSFDSFQSIDGSANTIVRITNQGGSGIVQTPSNLIFTTIGSGAGNTSLGISTFGTNGDLLTVGGTVNTRNIASSTCAGTSSVPIGSAFVIVACPVVQAGSKIILSHKGVELGTAVAGPAQNQLTYDPSATIPGTSFKVYVANILGQAQPVADTAATFDWLVIN
jgi:hypothetical protein